MTKKKIIQIPFDKETGNLMAYVYFESEEIEWRDNYEFDARLTIVDYTRGRSSVKFIVEDELGTQYELFISDMMNVLKKRCIDRGSFSGTFTFCKKGANYGLKLVN